MFLTHARAAALASIALLTAHCSGSNSDALGSPGGDPAMPAPSASSPGNGSPGSPGGSPGADSGGGGGEDATAPDGGAKVVCPTAPPFDDADPVIKAQCTKLVYLAGGDNFRVIRSSDEGATWKSDSPIDLPGDDFVNTLAVGHGIVMVIGLPGLYTSTDRGQTFALAASVSHDGFDTYGGQISYGGGMFVLTDNQGTYGSPNGATWTAQTPFPGMPDRNGFGGHYHGAAYGKNRHIAIQDSAAVRSFDGATWSQGVLINASYQPNGAAFGNNVFVSVGSSPGGAFAASSADGITWQNVRTRDAASGLFGDLGGGVVFDGALFRAFTRSKTSFTSADGLTWTKVPISHAIEAAAVADGHFLGFGEGKLLLSSDGVTWLPAHTFGAGETFDINGPRVAVGRVLK